MKMTILKNFLILLCLTHSAFAASLDIGWGIPAILSEKIDKSNHKVLLWPIQVSNGTSSKRHPLLDIVAVTNTGKQYNATRLSKGNLGRYAALVSDTTSTKGAIFPAAAMQGFAIFEDIDPKAGSLYFYIGGLMEDVKSRKEIKKYIRITYKKIGQDWKWVDTDTVE
jgi:hypothetical protein